MEFKDVQQTVYDEYIKNGYLDEWVHPDFKQQWKNNLAEAGLIHTEVTELQEAIRDFNTEKITLECADIIIRTMNLCSRMGILLYEGIITKHHENLRRGRLHERQI